MECQNYKKREISNHYDYASATQGEDYNSHQLLQHSQESYTHNEGQGGFPFRINTVNVPIPQAYPVSVEKRIPVPVGVAINRPVAVELPQPYQITIERRIPVIVKRPVPYTVRVPVQVPIVQRVEIPIHRPYPILVPRPVTIPIPRPVIVESQFPVIINGEDDDNVGEGGLEGNNGEQEHDNYKYPNELFSIQNFHNQFINGNEEKGKVSNNQYFSHQ